METHDFLVWFVFLNMHETVFLKTEMKTHFPYLSHMARANRGYVHPESDL